MKKRNKIIYWIVTGFLAFGMTAGGVQQFLQIGGYIEIIQNLGYPKYILPVLGIWKILGVIAILIPKYSLLKEWAYAGFFFAMSGAAVSHFANGEPFTEALSSLVLLLVTILSWYFRPDSRKIVSLQKST
ncbi:DoxX family protein [Pareuzebyella sediminis]|uniref:DoxX family protein n=1 Tax=Pareuzebyella sediminis TaxID=2607998 RepID=UPI0011EE0819|nr:DoxX family protein [Pareuzebyella sediminis]